MRLALFFTVSAMAVAAAAQEVPVAEPQKDEAPASGLTGLSETVDSLSDQATEEQAEPEAGTDAAAQSTDSVAGSETTPEESESAPAATPPAQSVQPSLPPPPINAEQRAEIDSAVLRGRQLFAIARAGMLASQDMLSRVADPEEAGIKGWIAEPEGNAMGVTFYADGEDGPVAVYRAQILGGRAVSRETFLTGARPSLAGIAERMARARAASESDGQQACTDRPFNVLVVPPEGLNAPIQVYRFSTPDSPTNLPLGGHFRATVAADLTVSETRGFTRGCLNVAMPEVPAGARPGPIAITHLLDPLPTEAHVFLSLLSGRPLIVAAGDPTRLFVVAGDNVREMRR